MTPAEAIAQAAYALDLAAATAEPAEAQVLQAQIDNLFGAANTLGIIAAAATALNQLMTPTK